MELNDETYPSSLCFRCSIPFRISKTPLSLSTSLLSLFNEIWCERPIILLISIHKRAARHVDGREPYVAQEQRGKNIIPWSPGDEQDDPAMGNSLSPPASDPRFDLAARQI